MDDCGEEVVGEGEGEGGRSLAGLPPAHQQHALEVVCMQRSHTQIKYVLLHVHLHVYL